MRICAVAHPAVLLTFADGAGALQSVYCQLRIELIRGFRSHDRLLSFPRLAQACDCNRKEVQVHLADASRQAGEVR
jgi:hypothetical protein